jgi:Mn-dependent DtxR family transcriptional regulator
VTDEIFEEETWRHQELHRILMRQLRLSIREADELTTALVHYLDARDSAKLQRMSNHIKEMAGR